MCCPADAVVVCVCVICKEMLHLCAVSVLICSVSRSPVLRCGSCPPSRCYGHRSRRCP